MAQGKLAIMRVVASISLETGDGVMRFDFTVPIKGEHTIDAIADDLAKKLRTVAEHAMGVVVSDNSAQIAELNGKLLAAQVEIDKLKTPKTEASVAVMTVDDQPRRRRRE